MQACGWRASTWALTSEEAAHSSPPPPPQVLVHAFPHSEPSSCNTFLLKPPLAFRVWTSFSVS